MASLADERDRLRKEAFLIARGERLGELRGRRLKRFDDQGLHPFSVVIGKITVIEWMLDTPSEERVHPVALKSEAVADAHRAIIEEIREGGQDPWD